MQTFQFKQNWNQAISTNSILRIVKPESFKLANHVEPKWIKSKKTKRIV